MKGDRERGCAPRGGRTRASAACGPQPGRSAGRRPAARSRLAAARRARVTERRRRRRTDHDKHGGSRCGSAGVRASGPARERERERCACARRACAAAGRARCAPRAQPPGGAHVACGFEGGAAAARARTKDEHHRHRDENGTHGVDQLVQEDRQRLRCARARQRTCAEGPRADTEERQKPRRLARQRARARRGGAGATRAPPSPPRS
jgi:hypothetical protein